jgi:hypothetical protein
MRRSFTVSASRQWNSIIKGERREYKGREASGNLDNIKCFVHAVHKLKIQSFSLLRLSFEVKLSVRRVYVAVFLCVIL